MQQGNGVAESTKRNLTYLTLRKHRTEPQGDAAKFYIIFSIIYNNWFVCPHPLLKTQFSIQNNLDEYFLITFPMQYSFILNVGSCPEVLQCSDQLSQTK